MSLLDSKTGFTTPWHCSVALLTDGNWISAPMGEFQKDPKMKLVYEDGRPSYFQETAGEDSSKPTPANSQDPTRHQIAPSVAAPSSLEDSDLEKIHVLAKSISNEKLRDENGEPVNPFFGSKNPLLDPNSPSFNIRTWLQTVMNIASRDSERYPKGVAGIAYKNLSVHGVGEATDYQKTFGNYPLELIKHAKKLFSKERQTKIQILRDFDGLVRSGEMLVVLGRPGR